jgi:hypothetical protein
LLTYKAPAVTYSTGIRLFSANAAPVMVIGSLTVARHQDYSL